MEHPWYTAFLYQPKVSWVQPVKPETRREPIPSFQPSSIGHIGGNNTFGGHNNSFSGIYVGLDRPGTDLRVTDRPAFLRARPEFVLTNEIVRQSSERNRKLLQLYYRALWMASDRFGVLGEKSYRRLTYRWGFHVGRPLPRLVLAWRPWLIHPECVDSVFTAISMASGPMANPMYAVSSNYSIVNTTQGTNGGPASLKSK
jgi:hypothetical protein